MLRRKTPIVRRGFLDRYSWASFVAHWCSDTPSMQPIAAASMRPSRTSEQAMAWSSGGLAGKIPLAASSRPSPPCTSGTSASRASPHRLSGAMALPVIRMSAGAADWVMAMPPLAVKVGKTCGATSTANPIHREPAGREAGHSAAPRHRLFGEDDERHHRGHATIPCAPRPPRRRATMS